MTKHKDLVCGMEVESSQAAAQEEFGGETYYFCSTHCREKFLEDPASFTSEHAPTSSNSHSGHGHGH